MRQLFFTALMFYTRLPVPKNIDHSADLLNRSTLFFPFIGWIVGSIGVGTFWLASWLFSPELAVLLSMIATIWATGAFHEDGFADMCDGFGGGWSKAQILTIMKDSRLGTYGVVGVGLLLAVKFLALTSLLVPTTKGWPSLILVYLTAHSVSRFVAVTLIAALPYAREDAESKAKPIAQGITPSQLAIAALFGLIPLLALAIYSGDWRYMLVLVPLTLVRWRLIRWFTQWLGGYTGDCLGATQQLAEVIVYLSFAALLRY